MCSTAPWAITRATTPMRPSWRQGAPSALSQVCVRGGGAWEEGGGRRAWFCEYGGAVWWARGTVSFEPGVWWGLGGKGAWFRAA
jgi:hypothetical protein